jgi:threonine/homoserine/homoserine lactone efflux protein
MSVMAISYLPVAAAGVAWLTSAAAFAVATAGTPGPNNAMLTSSGSLWGFRRTVPHMLGISLGFPIMLVAVASGAGGLLRDHPTVLTVMRWVGAAYLLYLAVASAGGHPSLARALILAGVFLAVTLPITALWTMVGVGVSRVFTTSRALRGFNATMAALLVASVVSVLIGIG